MDTLAYASAYPNNDGVEMSALPASRYATVRRKVPLKTGRFVVDFPVPEKYLALCTEKTGNEFTHLRYTAVTCDPDEYGQAESGYTLRPKLAGRETELFIVMTMYNEDEELFAKTMTSVQKNIAYLCSDKCPVSWGPNGWQNVVVCIVSDGRMKISKRVLTMLQVMGIYAPGLERTQVESKNVTGHIYEFTTQIAVDKDLNIRGHRDGIVPVQVLFCMKEKNAKKINSHRWFFNAFGPVLNPNVCVLLDVGTKPTGTSIYHLWRAFDRDPQVGGACGEIVAELGKGCANLLNPLVAAQNFEYKMSNILDKPLESVFGYIQVLPGAFSAYRYTALANSSPTTGPLASYFQGENHTGETDVFKANMYLAEDRILCFELVTKRNQNWILKYVKNARAETDVPDSLPELVSQRRRWLNGSFFAAVHSVSNYNLFFRSSHSTARKVAFTIQEAYNVFNLVFSWFAIGNFYLTFHFLFQSTKNPDTDPFGSGGQGYTLFLVLRYLYFGALGTLVIISFGNRPQGSKTLYYGILCLFAVLMGFLLFMGGDTVYQGVPKSEAEWETVGNKLINEPAFRDIIISLGSTYGLYLVSSLMHLDPWHTITSMAQYLLLLPVYINVFMVYAFCNLHDISWGTKGDNVAVVANTAPAVKTKDSGEAEVTVDLPQDDEDTLNAQYAITVEALLKRPDKVYQSRDRQTKIDDYFRLYRTRVGTIHFSRGENLSLAHSALLQVVLTWIICNVLLIIIFTTDAITNKLYANIQDLGQGSVNPYLTFIFWSVAILSLIRFIGSTWYLITWLMEGMHGAVTGRRTFVPKTQASQPRGGQSKA
ncbi:Chitin synthase, class 1 [Thoreauomyces humboldtii]|nr:Chitin synthase, class 1 [Thoreauomyces humboldtii]